MFKDVRDDSFLLFVAVLVKITIFQLDVVELNVTILFSPLPCHRLGRRIMPVNLLYSILILSSWSEGKHSF